MNLTMRLRIVRTLIWKDWQRQRAQRSTLILLVMWLAGSSAVLLFVGESVFSLPGTAATCIVDFWNDDDPWVEHLRQSVPDSLKSQVRFRSAANGTDENGVIVYPRGSGGIQIRPSKKSNDYIVWIWHPDQGKERLARFEAWFWRASADYVRQQSSEGTVPTYTTEHSVLHGVASTRAHLAGVLLLFEVFFVCVYSLATAMAEERERALVLAQAISPASFAELIVAKIVFYSATAIIAAIPLVAFVEPTVLVRPTFWLALLAVTSGSASVGVIIVSLARTQRNASLGAMCYLTIAASIVFLCQHFGIDGLPLISIEYLGSRLLHGSLVRATNASQIFILSAAIVIALAWTTIAWHLFRRVGWQ